MLQRKEKLFNGLGKLPITNGQVFKISSEFCPLLLSAKFSDSNLSNCFLVLNNLFEILK